MSAFLVGNEHIQCLVDAGLRDMSVHPLSWYVGNQRRELNEITADRVGQMLNKENRRSINHRYPKDANQDPIPMFKWRLLVDPRRDPVFVLKAIDCYEYQSCEHEGGETSEAKAFCAALRSKMIGELPGYDKMKAWPVGS